MADPVLPPDPIRVAALAYAVELTRSDTPIDDEGAEVVAAVVLTIADMFVPWLEGDTRP